MSEEEIDRDCPQCGKLRFKFDWVDGVPFWKCECGAKWKDSRW